MTTTDAGPKGRALDRDLTISLWIDVPDDRAGIAGGLASQYDPATRTGFSLSTISSAGGYCGPSDELRISFGIDAGTEPQWFDAGRPSPTSNYVSNSLTVFDGALHAATSDAPDAADRGHVFRHLGGTAWQDLGKVATEDASGIGPLVVHRDALYAASWNYDWTRVHEQSLDACHVYRYVAPDRWEDCGQPGHAKRLFSLASYRGDLLAAGDDSTIHAYRGDGRWELVRRFDTFAHPMGVHGGRLILGMLQPATVWSSDGSSWEDLGNPVGAPEVTDEIHSIVTYRDDLWVGTWRLGRVARWDAARRVWRQAGRLGDATEIMDLTVYNGKLYASSIPRAEIFRYERDRDWTSITRLFDPPGWRPVLVANMERPPDGDRRMREWTRVTSLTEHAGALYASTGSCTSAAVDAPTDVRGTVVGMRAGTVATTTASLAPGHHHIAATRRGARLAVHVDGRLAAEADGSITGSIASGAPLLVGEDATGRYRGGIHDVRFEERALDPDDIAALVAAGPATPEEDRT